MNATFEALGGLTVIRPEGPHLDAGRVREFRKDVVERLAPGMRVLLDLAALQFIDSAGCGAILACSRRVHPDESSPGGLKICGVSRPVRSIFQMIRLHKVIDIHNTRDEALRAFEAERESASMLG
ncbi:MAG: STAS domain-containing protein [Isosphaeraceae bacterium]